MIVIETQNLVKKYGELTAVNGIDIKVESGECFGLLGPNGAGKTTLVKMITAVAPITAGKAWVDGLDVQSEPRNIKSVIGVVPQEENLDPDFSVLKNLLVFSRYFSIPSEEAKKRALENLELFELQGRQQTRIRELSGGMKRRLLIARALINKPKIVVLDEPTVGLDPQTKHLVWSKLNSLKNQGVSLLLSTQNMEEATRLCDRLAIMNEGKFIIVGSPEEIVRQHGGSSIIEAQINSTDYHFIEKELNRIGNSWQKVGDTFHIFLSEDSELSEELMKNVVVFTRRKPTLEDVFLKLTGRIFTE